MTAEGRFLETSGGSLLLSNPTVKIVDYAFLGLFETSRDVDFDPQLEMESQRV